MQKPELTYSPGFYVYASVITTVCLKLLVYSTTHHNYLQGKQRGFVNLRICSCL